VIYSEPVAISSDGSYVVAVDVSNVYFFNKDGEFFR